MKKYLVEFKMTDGSKERVTFETDRLQWTIDQWARNRPVSKWNVVNEEKNDSKSMLFG